MTIHISTYESSDVLPALPGHDVFHSTDLFRLLEQTPGYHPIMLVAYDTGKIVGKLLCITRRNPQLAGFTHKTYAYGSGEYFCPYRNQEQIFGQMLSHITHHHPDHSFLIEFRNLNEPLFGYRYFRLNGYFPIRWMRVRNSIHHDTPDRWMSASRKKQITRGLQNGAAMCVAQSTEEVEEFFCMMKKYYSSKISRYLPDLRFFISLLEHPQSEKLGKIYLVKYKQKIIGGSVCLFSPHTAFLLFSGGMRKSYPTLYPGVLAVWNAMQDSHRCGYHHFEFIEAGIPFKKYNYRNFILRFGGKQLSTRRWFRIRWKWLNNLLVRLYV